MLSSPEIIHAVADSINKYEKPPLVLDPVMVATTGARLLENDAVKVLIEQLFPLATIVTPNALEAAALLVECGYDSYHQSEIQTKYDLVRMARHLQCHGPKWVLVKGGHCPFRRDGKVARTEEEKEVVVNVLYGENKTFEIEFPYVNTHNTHGTGCSLACKSVSWSPFRSTRETRADYLISLAAIASNLAKGSDIIQAVKMGCQYVDSAIRTAPNLGQGNGPINHFHSLQALPFGP